VKAILALGLLVAVGFAVAGCAGGKKSGTGPIEVTLTRTSSNVETGRPTASRITVVGSTATIANVRTGTQVRCQGWMGPSLKVPPPGQGVYANQGTGVITRTRNGHSSSEEVQLTHLQNGSLKVVCRASG
jgi:hypothetical protein